MKKNHSKYKELRKYYRELERCTHTKLLFRLFFFLFDNNNPSRRQQLKGFRFTTEVEIKMMGLNGLLQTKNKSFYILYDEIPDFNQIPISILGGHEIFQHLTELGKNEAQSILNDYSEAYMDSRLLDAFQSENEEGFTEIYQEQEPHRQTALSMHVLYFIDSKEISDTFHQFHSRTIVHPGKVSEDLGKYIQPTIDGSRFEQLRETRALFPYFPTMMQRVLNIKTLQDEVIPMEVCLSDFKTDLKTYLFNKTILHSLSPEEIKAYEKVLGNQRHKEIIQQMINECAPEVERLGKEYYNYLKKLEEASDSDEFPWILDNRFQEQADFYPSNTEGMPTHYFDLREEFRKNWGGLSRIVDNLAANGYIEDDKKTKLSFVFAISGYAYKNFKPQKVKWLKSDITPLYFMRRYMADGKANFKELDNIFENVKIDTHKTGDKPSANCNEMISVWRQYVPELIQIMDDYAQKKAKNQSSSER